MRFYREPLETEHSLDATQLTTSLEIKVVNNKIRKIRLNLNDDKTLIMMISLLFLGESTITQQHHLLVRDREVISSKSRKIDES